MARRPETIRSGGFQGGQMVQAAQVPTTSALSQLADSLSLLNRQGSEMIGGAVDQHMKQLEIDGTPSGEQLIAEHAGLDIAGWEAQMQDPNVAEVLKNPFAAAVVDKFRGRLQADELFQGLVAAGVNPADKAAVDAFYKEKAPSFEGTSKFFTSGFNEQNQRHQAQLFQQGIAKNAADIAATTREAATTAFGDALSAGPITTESVAGAFAVLKDPAFGNLSGTEVTQMQADFAQKLAAEGRVDELTVFLSTKRGDAPALQDSAGVVDDAPTWIAQAKRVAEGDAAARDATLKLSIFKRIDDNSRPLMTLDTLEAQPEYTNLTEQGKLAAYSHWEAEKNSRRSRAESETNRRLLAATQESNTLQAASLLKHGQGWAVDAGQAQDGLEYLRNEIFGGKTWDQLDMNDAEAIKKYSVMMGQSNHIDDTLSRYLTGAGAYLSVETLTGQEKNLAQVFGVYQMLDVNAARRAVKDDRTQSLLDEMDTISRGYPNRPVEQVAIEAVNRINGKGDSFVLPAADLKSAISKTKLTAEVRAWWPDKTVHIDNNDIYPYVRERAREVWEVNGHNTEGALKTAIEDAKTKAFAPVNGKPVRVPQGEGWTPERFARGAEEHLRSVDPEGYADWNIAPMAHGAYRISPPPGYEGEYSAIVLETQLADAAATHASRMQAEKDAKDAAIMAERDRKRYARVKHKLDTK
jgi:hypothetical protein